MASIARSSRAVRASALSGFMRAAPPRQIVRSVPRRTFMASPIALVKKYTKDHEWIDINTEKGTGVMGITEYAAEQLGDVVYVELPEVGATLKAGDGIGAVESVKSASDINSPVACKVTHVNTALEETPGIINRVPEDDSGGGGWVAKVEVDEEGIKELDGLMDFEAYKALTEQEQEEH